MSSDNLQANCRLCQQNPGVITVIDNEEFIAKVFEVTRVKINHEQMQLFPKAVCATCQLSIEEMYCFIQKIRSIDKKLHASIDIWKSTDTKTHSTRRKCKYGKTSKVEIENKGNTFNCPTCQKTFITYRNLQIHMDSHSQNSTGRKNDTDLEKNIINNQDEKSLCTENCPLNNDKEKKGIKSENEDFKEKGVKSENHHFVEKGIKSEVEDSDEKEDSKLHSQSQELNSKKSKNMFPCTFESCSKVCTSSYTFRTHLMKHEGKTPFLCVTCGKGFRTKNSLNCHEKIHAKVKAYVCDKCNIRFSVSSNLRAHQRKHHEGIRYYCSQCPLVYISKYSLERHELVHTGIKEYKCDTCKAAFYTSKELMKHQRYHQGLRLYKCEQCFKTFFENHHLTIHMRGHTGERPYACKIIGCGKSFTESQKLTRHLKARHPLL